jgi:hypothetical protein
VDCGRVLRVICSMASASLLEILSSGSENSNDYTSSIARRLSLILRV